MVVFPTQAKIVEMFASGVLHSLCGLEHESGHGKGKRYNFILSNGQRSTERDNYHPTDFTFMIPAYKMIKSVDIIYTQGWCIMGFKFFGKDKVLLFEIGYRESSMKAKTVTLKENEAIIGFVCKNVEREPTRYTDFQL